MCMYRQCPFKGRKKLAKLLTGGVTVVDVRGQNKQVCFFNSTKDREEKKPFCGVIQRGSGDSK